MGNKGIWGLVLLAIVVVVVVAWWGDFFHVRGDVSPTGPQSGVSAGATNELPPRP